MTARRSADRMRKLIERGPVAPAIFRSALLEIVPERRDLWLDWVLGIDGLPDDEPALPRGCVPYLPCPVDALLRMVDAAKIVSSDVFVDIGSGAGRAAACVHLLTGAAAIGVEIQPGLARASRELAESLPFGALSIIEGDAGDLIGPVMGGSVFFLYCPFSGERLSRWLAVLEPVARAQPLRIACVDVPLPARAWLELASRAGGDLAVYRTVPDGGAE